MLVGNGNFVANVEYFWNLFLGTNQYHAMGTNQYYAMGTNQYYAMRMKFHGMGAADGV